MMTPMTTSDDTSDHTAIPDYLDADSDNDGVNEF